MRSEEDILAGVLHVQVGGVTKALPTLKLRKAREWKVLVAETLSTQVDTFDLTGAGDMARLANMAGDRVLDLVLAYDQSGALGGREWLEDNADDAQLYAILRTALETSFPFVHDLQSGLAQVRGVLAANALVPVAPAGPAVSPGERPTNGRSPSGV